MILEYTGGFDHDPDAPIVKDIPAMNKSIEEVTKEADGGGLRYDAGKNRLDLIPVEWVWALGTVLTKGAAKYEDRNWERGMPWSKVVGPMLRHIFKFLAGEKYDPETGCHHMAMVAWNALALMSYDIRSLGKKDLNKYDYDILGRCMAPETPQPWHNTTPQSLQEDINIRVTEDSKQ